MFVLLDVVVWLLCLIRWQTVWLSDKDVDVDVSVVYPTRSLSYWWSLAVKWFFKFTWSDRRFGIKNSQAQADGRLQRLLQPDPQVGRDHGGVPVVALPRAARGDLLQGDHPGHQLVRRDDGNANASRGRRDASHIRVLEAQTPGIPVQA